MFGKLLEYTLRAARQKQGYITWGFPRHWQRVDAVKSRGGLKLVRMVGNEMFFSVASGTKPGVSYQITLRLRNPVAALEQTYKSLGYKDSKQIDWAKFSKLFLENVNIETQCSCAAASYWAFNYIQTSKRAKMGKREVRSPKRNNTRQYGFACKHMQLLLDEIEEYIPQVSKYLQYMWKMHHKEEAEVEQEEEVKDAGADPKADGNDQAVKEPEAPKEPGGGDDLR